MSIELRNWGGACPHPHRPVAPVCADLVLMTSPVISSGVRQCGGTVARSRDRPGRPPTVLPGALGNGAALHSAGSLGHLVNVETLCLEKSFFQIHIVIIPVPGG